MSRRFGSAAIGRGPSSDEYGGIGAFMSGISQGREQNERDTRLAMEIEGRRAALERQKMADERDSVRDAREAERFQLDRDRAIRDTRDSDFRYQGAVADRTRQETLRKAGDEWATEFLMPRQSVGPDGQPRTDPPRMSTFDGQVEGHMALMRIRAQAGPIKPEELAQYNNIRKEAEKNGLINAIVRARTGDNAGLLDVVRKAGADPQSVQIQTTVDPNTQLPTTKIVGTGKDGKPFDFDLAPVFTSMGLSYDPDKPGQDRAKAGAEILQRRAQTGASEAAARSSDASAGAARANAESLGQLRRAQTDAINEGRSSTGRPAARQTTDTELGWDDKADKDFISAVEKVKPQLPNNVRVLMRGLWNGEEDQSGRMIVNAEGRRLAREAFTGGRRLSPGEAALQGQRELAAINEEAGRRVGTVAFMKDPATNEFRVVRPGTPGAKPLGSMVGTDRAVAFKTLRDLLYERANAAGQDPESN